MGLIVQKFGGSSVANAERIKNVAQIVTDTYAQGNMVVVVVSAQGDTTDDLIEKAKEINPNASPREMDVLLSTGEQISISLLSMAIEALGFPVKSLTGWQAGFLTKSTHGSARINKINKERIENELGKKNIVVVAGFQGINRYDDITTLGRGGSDTSAVALAAALHADCCQIYTDVDGVYTADPRLVKNARKLDEVSYDEMLELASLGAQVLHNRSVEMAKKYSVKLHVLSSLNRGVPGTEIKEVVDMEKMLIKGVARDNDVARISLIGVPDRPGVAFKLFSLLAANKINVDIILQSVGRNNTKDISFTTSRSHMKQTVELLETQLGSLNAERVEYGDNISKISIVGAGMQTHFGVASKMFEALSDAGINIQMISTSEIKISVLIDINDSERALNVIHDAFIV
ncbi:MAG: aspartate kinase [Oscillospiraceae bacterium]|nr:aspartate kinase [Oscillospiraceae bacterium]